jgi:hypothetical protein
MDMQIQKDIHYSMPQEALMQRINERGRHPVSGRIKKMMKRAVSDIRRNSNFKALFKISNIQVNNGTLLVSDQSLESSKLRNILAPCHKAVVFLTTLGEDIDELIKTKIQKKPSYGYILDAAASMAVESGTSQLMDNIADDLEGNIETTQRYSPGYCDWSLGEQKKLFNILPSKHIGVTLNRSFLMKPRKSISGIIGICRKGSMRYDGNACLKCSNLDCSYRRDNK